MKPNKIIVHWTGGRYQPNAVDKKSYHFLIDGAGVVVKGNFTPEDNCRTPLRAGTYAAHVRGANSGAIGVSIAAMHGATEKPLDFGEWPVKKEQWASMVSKVAELCKQYDIPVTEQTVLMHSEVEKYLGVEQKQKWDLDALKWLPGFTRHQIGALLRNDVRLKLIPAPIVTEPVAKVSQPAPKESDMIGTKSIFTSKTFWGALTSTVGKIAAIWLGSEAAAAGVTDVLTQAQVLIPMIISFAGDVFAVFGRVTATKTIG